MGCPVALLWVVKFLYQAEAELDAIRKAGLLVRAAEVTDSVQNLVFFAMRFARYRFGKAY